MHIDLLSPKSFDGGQPHDQFRWLREHDPVHRHEEPGGRGFWAVTRYEDVRAIGRDPAHFSSEPTIMIADPMASLAFGEHKMMLMMDPPQHTAYRKVIAKRFLQKNMAPFESRVRTVVDGLIEVVVGGVRCAFQSAAEADASWMCDVAALLWFVAVRRYHQERLAISG